MRRETCDIPTDMRFRLIVLAGLLCLGSAAAADRPGGDAPQAVRDAWIDGRLQATFALNSFLSQFSIDTSVDGGVVKLSGTVGSDIQRELAVTLARQVDGVENVQDALTIRNESAAAPDQPVGDRPPTFRQRVEDATATARVKTNLQSNGNTRALSIDVDTEDGVVILKGTVSSLKEKMLAEMIARNTDGIANVRNQLEINGQT